MKTYKKPEMKKVELINKQSVADRCWSLASDDPIETEEFWFDLNGREHGFYHFILLRNSCGNNTENLHLYYHTDRSDMTGTEITDWTPYYEFMDEDVLGPHGAPPSFGNGYPHTPSVIEDSY